MASTRTPSPTLAGRDRDAREGTSRSSSRSWIIFFRSLTALNADRDNGRPRLSVSVARADVLVAVRIVRICRRILRATAQRDLLHHAKLCTQLPPAWLNFICEIAHVSLPWTTCNFIKPREGRIASTARKPIDLAKPRWRYNTLRGIRDESFCWSIRRWDLLSSPKVYTVNDILLRWGGKNVPDHSISERTVSPVRGECSLVLLVFSEDALALLLHFMSRWFGRGEITAESVVDRFVILCAKFNFLHPDDGINGSHAPSVQWLQ